jgi:hypothetical protein
MVVVVVKEFEKFVKRIGVFRSRGKERYGYIQILIPKEYIGKSAYVKVYVYEEEPTSRDVVRKLAEGEMVATR